MEKYRRAKLNQAPPHNEVRVNRDTPTNNYVRYVMTQFKECGAEKVHIVAMGEAIYKIITIAELVRYRVPGLHQINDINCREFKDEYLPNEEGLDKLVFRRKVACFKITLIKNGTNDDLIDPNFYGYQEPLPD